MSNDRRKRHDPRRETTREALIEAAELMVGEMGPDGVSLRQIGSAVGSLNKTVVSYYFGSKEELLEAVYRHRLSSIDERRGVLLSATEDTSDIASLMRVLWLPLFEQTSSSGQHSYARFLGAMARSGWGKTRRLLAGDFQQTAIIVELIGSAIPAYAAQLRTTRWPVIVSMVLDTLLIIDLEGLGNGKEGQARFDDGVTMATAALLAKRGE